MRYPTPLLAALISASAIAAPTQYTTVVEAIESGGDYSVESGNLIVVSQAPLQVIVKPFAVKGDFPEVLTEISKREVVWTALQVFAHTSVNEITVTCLPEEVNFQTNAKRPLNAYKRTATVTRARFNGLVKKYLNLGSVADLIGDQSYGNAVIPDMPLEPSNRILYTDQGPPGLERFFSELVK